MNYSCKYPKKLNHIGFYNDILQKYSQHYELSCGISKNILSSLLSCVLKRIRYIIENPANDLKEVLFYFCQLLSLSNSSFLTKSRDSLEPKAAVTVIENVFYNPSWVIEFVESAFAVNITIDLRNDCIQFLQEATSDCIQQLVEVNKPKEPQKKQVTFLLAT